VSGWGVLGEPVLLVARVAMVVLVGLQLRRVVARVRPPGRAGVRPQSGHSGPADQRVVALYNDALLAGWPAGERATFAEVAHRLGTSADHVRAVVGRHRAA